MLNDLNKIMIDVHVKESYVDGDIDKFISNVINGFEESEKKTDKILRSLFEDDKSIDWEYIDRTSRNIRKLDLISTVMQTKKMEKNKKDLIKLGLELIKIANDLIEFGKGSANE